jgi:hypothetical protein
LIPHLEPVQIWLRSDHDESSHAARNAKFCAGFLHAMLEVEGHEQAEFSERPIAQTPIEDLSGDCQVIEFKGHRV